MPSFRIFLIAIAAGLALFLGFIWWLDGEQARRSRTEAPEVAQLLPRAAESPRQPEARPTVQPGITNKIPMAPTNADVGRAPAAPPLPVVLNFYRRMRDSDQRIEGSIANLSNNGFTITLNILSGRTRTVSQSVLEIPPQSRVVFGHEDGLNLEVGDQVTLQCPPYADLLQDIQRVQ